MANTQHTGQNYTYVTVDTAPAAAGYWTESVNMLKKNVDKMFFSQSGAGSATIVLQFKRPSDADWVDFTHGLTIEEGIRFVIEGVGAGVRWRAGVEEGGYVSGSVKFGFDW